MTRYIAHNGEMYPASDLRWRGDSGALLDLEFTPDLPNDAFTDRPHTMWRYREAIPIQDDADIISFDEGYTPNEGQTIDIEYAVWGCGST